MADDDPEWRPRTRVKRLITVIASVIAIAAFIGVFLVSSPKTAMPTDDARTASDAVRVTIGPIIMIERTSPDADHAYLADEFDASTAIHFDFDDEDGVPLTNYGSGVLIDQGLVLTVAHTVPHIDAYLAVVSCDSAEAQATTIAVDRLRDLALFEAAECAGTKRRIADVPPWQEAFAIVGFDYTNYGTAGSQGIQTLMMTSLCPGVSLRKMRCATNTETCEATNVMIDLWAERGIAMPYAVSGALKPGWSGAPAFNADGDVVGIMTIGVWSHNRSYLIRPSVIKDVLRDAGL